MSIHEKPAPARGVRQTCRESPATAKIHFSPSAAGNCHEYTFTLTDVNVNVEWSGMAWSGIKLILKNWSYLRKFSKSSRLQDDQERSLGLRPLTHSPDIMWECPVQVAWSSSWLIPMLGKAKDQSLMPLKRHIKEPHTSCKYRHVSTRKTEMTQPKLLIFTLHSFTDLNYPHCKNALCNKLHSEGKKKICFSWSFYLYQAEEWLLGPRPHVAVEPGRRPSSPLPWRIRLGKPISSICWGCLNRKGPDNVCSDGGGKDVLGEQEVW